MCAAGWALAGPLAWAVWPKCRVAGAWLVPCLAGSVGWLLAWWAAIRCLGSGAGRGHRGLGGGRR